MNGLHCDTVHTHPWPVHHIDRWSLKVNNVNEIIDTTSAVIDIIDGILNVMKLWLKQWLTMVKNIDNVKKTLRIINIELDDKSDMTKSDDDKPVVG